MMQNNESHRHFDRKSVIVASLLLLLGLAQMAGELLGSTGLKAVAASTMLSPLPKVFTAHKGFETYSTRFFVEFADIDGKPHSVEITNVLYNRVRGPYNRRNVYGAVLSYGPVLAVDPVARPMFDAVARYAVCGDAPLLHELGIDPATIKGPVRIRYEPAPGVDMGTLPRILEVQR